MEVLDCDCSERGPKNTENREEKVEKSRESRKKYQDGINMVLPCRRDAREVLSCRRDAHFRQSGDDSGAPVYARRS